MMIIPCRFSVTIANLTVSMDSPVMGVKDESGRDGGDNLAVQQVGRSSQMCEVDGAKSYKVRCENTITCYTKIRY